MTKNTERFRDARDRSLKVWDWLRKNPGHGKKDLPPYLYSLVKTDPFYCPLCNLFHKTRGLFQVKNSNEECVSLCPLTSCDSNSLYSFWDKDSEHAEKIYQKILAWDPENPVGTV